MIIRKIIINGFGKIGNLEIRPEKGFNIIYGSNEAGKSTIQWFIKGMFYGLKGGREKNGVQPPLKYFIPWNYTNYGGLIEYSIKDNEIYTVSRDFVDNSTKILDSSYNDITNNFEIGKDKSVKFAEAHLGLNEACFEKSVFIKQMDVKVDGSGREELLSKIVNASETGFDDVSFKKAEKALKDALITYVGTEKTSSRPLDKINARLEELIEELAKIEDKRLMILDIEEKLNDSIKQMEKYRKQIEFLNNLIEIVEIIKIINENDKIRQELYEIKAELLKIQDKASQNSNELKKNIDNLINECKSCLNQISICNKEYNKRQENMKFIDASFIASVTVLTISVILSVIFNLKPDLINIKNIINNSDFFKISLITCDVLFLIISASLYFLKKIITRKIDNILNKKNDFEKHYKLAEEEIAQYKASNISMVDTAEYLIRRAYALTGTNIGNNSGYAKDIEETPLNIDKAIKGVQKEIDEIQTHTSYLINDVKELIEELDNNICDKYAKWIEYIKSIIESFDSVVEVKVETREVIAVEEEITMCKDKLNENIHNLSLSIKEYETIISTSGFDNYRLQEITESVQELEEKKNNLLKLRFSLSKALEVLTSAKDEIKKEYMPSLNKKMSHYIKKLTEEKYFDLRANDKLELMILESDTSKIVPIGQLSKGTIDQAYLAFRLALSDIFSSGGEVLPLIMDEVFAQYDDSRVETALKMFRELSKERQIFMFTCKKREIEIAREVFKEDVNLILLS